MKYFKLFVLASTLYGCAGNHPESIIPSDTPSQTNKAILTPATLVKGKVEINNAEPFFQGLDALQAKVKAFDPTMGELDIMPSDSMFYEGKDTHHNKLQVSGANNGISELSWIWNHDGFQKPPASAIKNFTAIAKIMCGTKGQQWVLSELKKPVSVDKPISDTIHINRNEVIFFNDCLTTINFKVKIL